MTRKPNFEQFAEEIELRNIDYLIHFTPTINLLSIFEQEKILSRLLLEKFDIDQTDIFDFVEFTDDFRFDDKNYINLSIQHPNHFLFSRFQQRTIEESHITWCILKIDIKYIYHADTLFSVTNAANGYNKRNIGITGDFNKFTLMFQDDLTVITTNGSRTLSRRDLLPKYPTDEQAEVLVKDTIPVSSILQVCFKTDKDLAAGKAALNNFNTSNFVVDTEIFSNKRI